MLRKFKDDLLEMLDAFGSFTSSVSKVARNECSNKDDCGATRIKNNREPRII